MSGGAISRLPTVVSGPHHPCGPAPAFPTARGNSKPGLSPSSTRQACYMWAQFHGDHFRGKGHFPGCCHRLRSLWRPRHPPGTVPSLTPARPLPRSSPELSVHPSCPERAGGHLGRDPTVPGSGQTPGPRRVWRSERGRAWGAHLALLLLQLNLDVGELGPKLLVGSLQRSEGLRLVRLASAARALLGHGEGGPRGARGGPLV